MFLVKSIQRQSHTHCRLSNQRIEDAEAMTEITTSKNRERLVTLGR